MVDRSFLEQYAYPSQRAEALSRLIPGSEDFYYYSCHHRLLNDSFDGLDDLLKAWTEKHGRGQRLREIENRRALLAPSTKESIEHLSDQLGLTFNHQKSVSAGQLEIGHQLNDRSLSFETLKNKALRDKSTLREFRPTALSELPDEALSVGQIRDLLKRLPMSTHPRIVDLILTELADKKSGGFGSLPLHEKLLISQLEDLAERKAELMQDEGFVKASLSRSLSVESVGSVE